MGKSTSITRRPAHSQSKAKSRPARVLFSVGSYEITVRRLIVFAGVLVALGLVALFWRQFDMEQLHARAKALSAPGLIALCFVLPLVSFPVSVLHLLIGVRFDLGGGLAVVALVTMINELLAVFLVRVLPTRFFKRLDPWREKLKRAGHREATILCSLLPGLPYTAQIYVLPLMGVPLAVNLGLSVPIHTARSLVTLSVGGLSEDFTAGRIALIVVYYVIVLVATAWVLRSMRRHLNTESGSKP